MADGVGQMDRIMVQLDRDQPLWFLDWATGSQLVEHTADMRRWGVPDADRRLKQRHWSMLHRVVSAAIHSGVVSQQSLQTRALQIYLEGLVSDFPEFRPVADSIMVLMGQQVEAKDG